MNLQELAQDLIQELLDLGQILFPGMPQDIISHAGAILLGILAVILLLFALILLRPRSKGNSVKFNVPQTLQAAGTIIDVFGRPENETVSFRCAITSVKANKIICEIVERVSGLKTGSNNEVVCVFAPMDSPQGKVNSFTANLLDLGHSQRTAHRAVLSAPIDYSMTPRRKHIRKRVADQQFIRVKLWMEDPIYSDTSFQDATPQISVNSFSPDTPDQSSNGVINISKGGLGLSVVDQLIPETCSPDSPIVVNLFHVRLQEKDIQAILVCRNNPLSGRKPPRLHSNGNRIHGFRPPRPNHWPPQLGRTRILM